MSLLNDALKQAEADKLLNRPESAPPLPDSASSPPPLPRADDPAGTSAMDDAVSDAMPGETADEAGPQLPPPKGKSRMAMVVMLGLAAIALAAAWRLDVLPFVPKSAAARPTAVVAPQSNEPAAKPALADKATAADKPDAGATAAAAKAGSSARDLPAEADDARASWGEPLSAAQAALMSPWKTDVLGKVWPQRRESPSDLAQGEAQGRPAASPAANAPKASAAAPAPVAQAHNQAPAPTQAPVQSKPKVPAAPEIKFDPSKCKITGILAGADGGTAIINGRFVRMGQNVDGAKLVRVTPTGVELEANGRRYNIGM